MSQNITKIMNKFSTALVAFIFIFNINALAQDDIDRLSEKHQEPFGNLEITPYFGNVVYAAQPDENTVKMLKDQDFDLVINIRELNEDLGFDEKKLLEDQKIDYIQIPYLTAPDLSADFSNDALSKIKEEIDKATKEGKKILLHCSHGQRVASSLGMILYRDYGYSKEDALKAATAAGMNSKWSVSKFHKFIENSIVRVESFGGLNNVVKYKNFYIASQPSVEAINMMKERGISTIITNRAQKENGGFKEQEVVEAAGLKFYRARIYNDRYSDIKDNKLNIDELEKALNIISTTTDGDVFVHCGSGDRASMILTTHLYNIDNNTPNEAISKARIAGLKNKNITEQLEIYMGSKE